VTVAVPPLPALVVGRVRHTRFRPLRHSFTHAHYQWLIDLDRPPQLGARLARLSELRAEDHFDGRASTFPALKSIVLHEVRASGVELPDSTRVLLLAHGRVLGHVFDPLSVYWCLAPDGRPAAAVLEVRNTYAGRHTYVLTPGPQGTAEVDKDFLVSPFNDTRGRYAVRLQLTPERVAVAIRLDREGSALLNATVMGKPIPLTDASLGRALLRHPLMPQRVSALIRVHGIYLWLRRLPVLRKELSMVDDPRIAPAGRHTLLTRGMVARNLVHLLVRSLPVRLELPGGTTWGAGAENAPVLQVNRPGALFRRLETHPKIGLGEAFMAGDWQAGPHTDLADLLEPFAARVERLLPRPVLALRGIVERAIPHHHRNTPDGARANIAAHYDLSNDLFAGFLDETMTYSSALFDDTQPWEEQDLATAQRRKIDAALDAAGVGPGTSMLEIGTGWGELALRAAARGASVTTITLSREQQALARERAQAGGFSDRIDVHLCDYREVTGCYDAVVSIEMIEAVGEEFWPAYLESIDRLLAPGGAAVIQAILMDHQRYLATRNSFGWIQKHIFPGGLIPSLEGLEGVAARHTSLRVKRIHTFGRHYAHTLRRWRCTFAENWPQIATHGFDDVFRRQWEFYLAYCEAGFATGYLDVAQITLGRSRP
jgi:cyclopropane-fatty-acyl-phospholipid synthase